MKVDEKNFREKYKQIKELSAKNVIFSFLVEQTIFSTVDSGQVDLAGDKNKFYLSRVKR